MLKKFVVAFILLIADLNLVAQGQVFMQSASFTDLKSPITCLKISPNGKLLIAGDASGFISMRDAESGQQMSTMKTFDAPVECINFNSTGKLMVIASPDGEIKIFDLIQNKFIHSLFSPEYAGMRFALFSIADGFIYFNGQGRLYKIRSDLLQTPVKIYQFDSSITNAVITNDRSGLIFSCENTIHVLNTRTDFITQTLTTSTSSIEQLEMTIDSRIASWRKDGTITIQAYGLNQLDVNPISWFKAGSCSKFVFSHDGIFMVTGKTGTWARIWTPLEKTIVQEIFGHHGPVTNFAFSVDDQTLFTASDDRTMIVWKKKEKLISDSIKRNNSISLKTDSSEVKLLSSVSDTMEVELPAIELDQKNIPAFVGGRKVNRATDVFVSQPDLELSVYDNSTLDGDIVSLSFQHQWILRQYPVTKSKKIMVLHLSPGSTNCLVLFAENLGKTPPNTAVISFEQNGKEKIFRLESDLKSCSAINFIYQPK